MIIRSKVVPVLNEAPHHGGIWGNGSIDIHNPNLGTRWR
jgi:hypothetical protein